MKNFQRVAITPFIAVFYLFIASASSFGESPIVDLKPIIISAKRVPADEDSTAEQMSVITQEEIKDLPARDLGEVLHFIPGVDIQQTNQFGQPTAVSIRGADPRHVLLMVDGIPFNTQLSGQANPSRIPIEQIERIEVIKGASSSVWGSSLGGVINVITKDVGTQAVPKGKLTSAFAEFQTFKEALELWGAVKKVGYYFGGSYFQTEGIRAGADTEKNDVFGKMSLPLGDQAKVTGSFGYVREDLADRYTDPFFGLTEDTRLNYARYGKIELNVDKPDFDFNTAVKYNNQHLKTDLNLIDFAFLSPTINSNVYYGLSMNASKPLRETDLLVMGVDLDWTVFKSNTSLGEAKSVETQAPYMNYTWNEGHWSLIPGIRYDRNSEFGSQVSPSFGTVYHLRDSRDTDVRFKYSRAFNAPPLLWIYQHSAFTLPNPDLEPEKGDVYEAGVNSNLTKRVNMDLSVYWDEIEDAIESVDVMGQTQKQNFEKFRRRGGELLGNFEISDHWKAYSGVSFNDSRNKETNEVVRDSGVARKSVKAGLNFNHECGFSADLVGSYNQWNSDPDLKPKDQRFILDTKLAQRIEDIKNVDVELFLIVHNLTNTKNWASITFPLPQRYFEGGLSIEF